MFYSYFRSSTSSFQHFLKADCPLFPRLSVADYVVKAADSHSLHRRISGNLQRWIAPVSTKKSGAPSILFVTGHEPHFDPAHFFVLSNLAYNCLRKRKSICCDSDKGNGRAHVTPHNQYTAYGL